MKRQRLFVHNDPNPLRINGELALEIGFEESIILLQLEFLISISDNIRDGKRWTYQSAKELKEKYFKWWCEKTIRRVIARLIDKEYILSEQLNKEDWDRRNWYALNPIGLGKLKSVSLINADTDNLSTSKRPNGNIEAPEREHRSGQIVHIEADSQSLSCARVPDPDSGTETTTETTEEHGEPPSASTLPAVAASSKPRNNSLPSTDHQKLMKVLFDLTGPISDGKAQGAAIQWLLKNGYCVEDCEACLLDQLSNPNERWRSQVSWLTVRKCIGTWKAKQTIQPKTNGNGAETRGERNVRNLKEFLGRYASACSSDDNSSIPPVARLLIES